MNRQEVFSTRFQGQSCFLLLDGMAATAGWLFQHVQDLLPANNDDDFNHTTQTSQRHCIPPAKVFHSTPHKTIIFSSAALRYLLPIEDGQTLQQPRKIDIQTELHQKHDKHNTKIFTRTAHRHPGPPLHPIFGYPLLLPPGSRPRLLVPKYLGQVSKHVHGRRYLLH